MKKRINITIEAEIVEKAHELGLNVSKTCENALKEAIRRLGTLVPQSETNGGDIDSRKAVSSAKMVLRPGFEPGSTAFFLPHLESRGRHTWSLSCLT